MGNRVKGRAKKSSIKAALSSSAGSKRKLSRMGKRQKKEHSGLEASFVGRSQCLKYLQVTIKDFRRLCILKGIYPREPLGRVPGKKKGQAFYHIKDIRAIAHEPVLEKFREFRAFMKKVRKASGRNEGSEALRKNSILPTYNLHHLVKERYPRFVDAISDLDDALTLCYLFAALPSDGDVKPKYVKKAKELAAAWGAYCATTSQITKSFISVKGVYMEAMVSGVAVRWIVPHAFTQFMPEDVDFRVMNTFFEFYDTMLTFILFKLYNDIGIRYPFTVKDLGKERVGSTSALVGANLKALTNALNSSTNAITDVVSKSIDVDGSDTKNSSRETSKDAKTKSLVRSVGAALSKLKEDDSDEDMDDDDDDSVDIAGPLHAALENVANEEAKASVPGVNDTIDEEALKRKRLFEGLTFFLSREVPRGYLELVSLAFGARVGWEGEDSPITMSDPTITHHVVDRPRLPSSYETLPKSREYIQPQWILDCSNFLYILPITKYAAGEGLPPHLSPWVDNEEEGYKPKYAEEIERLKNGETVDQDDSSVVEESQEPTLVDVEHESSDSEEDVDEIEENDSKEKARMDRKRKKDEEEAHHLAKTMMTKKASHLHGRMMHGIAKKQAKVDALHERRKENDKKRKKVVLEADEDEKMYDGAGKLILKGKEKDKTGQTPGKQKLKRLKDERKSLGATYGKTSGTMKKANKKSRQK